MHLAQKVIYKVNDDIQFDLGLHYSTTSDYPRYDRLSIHDDANLKYAEWNYGPQDWLLANAQITKLSSRSSFYDKIKISAAYQNFKESRINRRFNSDTRKIRNENVDALSFNLDLNKQLSDRSNISYGTEIINNKVSSKGFTESISTNNITEAIASRYPDGSNWQTMAAYLSYKYKPNNRLTVQSGIRYNYVIIDADISDNNEFYNLPIDTANLETSAVTGTLGFSWVPNNTFMWKFNATTAFRAPNIDDIGKIFDSQNGLVVVPNSSLKPEYAYGAELGLTVNLNQSVIFDSSVYYTYLDNALVRKPFEINGETQMMYDTELSDIHAIQNASKSWIYGFEAGIKVLFSKELKLTTQYSYVHGTQEETPGVELPVRHAAPVFGNTHIIWKYNKLQLDGFINYNGSLRASEISDELADSLFALDSEGNPYSPSWLTLNFRTQFDFNDSVSFVGAVENITNQRYRTYSSGIASAGTNLIMAITYKF